MKRIVVFASGSGSNFQSIIDAIEQGSIRAEISGLIAGKPGIGAVQRAEKHNIPVAVLPSPDEPLHFSRFLLSALQKWNPDLIVLAGFMRKIPDAVVEAYRDKIINIHPSLLPKYGGKGFYGIRVHRAVIEADDQESGCTVHFVNEHYDDGHIIEQRRVPVLPHDTPEELAARVLKEEHRLLPDVVKQLLNQNSKPSG